MDWLTTTRAGLLCGMAAAVLLATTGNLVIAMAGWGNTESEQVPAGWEWVDRVVGFVWLGLFAAMATAAWLSYSSAQPMAVRDGRIVVGLMIVCILYPVYTLGLRPVPGLVANVVVLALVVAAGWVIRGSSQLAAGLLMPVAVWISIATVYVVKLLAVNR